MNGIKTISESLNISRWFFPPKSLTRPPTPPLGAFVFVCLFVFLFYFGFYLFKTVSHKVAQAQATLKSVTLPTWLPISKWVVTHSAFETDTHWKNTGYFQDQLNGNTRRNHCRMQDRPKVNLIIQPGNIRNIRKK